MKFLADKSILSDAVTNASKACAAKTALNSLDGVLLSLSGNNLTVTGYDLEMGIKINIIVDGVSDGEIVVDARLFGDMIKRMPSENKIEVNVENEKEITIKSGKIKFNIQGTSGNNFPNILDLNNNTSFAIGEPLLKSMLSQVSYAVSQNDSNPALMGARFAINDNCLDVVASDGVRLALRQEVLIYDDINFIVPTKTINELTRNLSDEATDEIVTITIDRNQICFAKKNYMIFSRLLEGKFIDYKRIIDFTPTSTAIINVREFSASLERTLLLITDRYKSPVICTFCNKGEDAVMKISCKTNIGSIDEEIYVNFDSNLEKKLSINNNGEEMVFSVAFNPRFMIDALKNSGCDEVKLQFLTELNPIKIVPLSEDGFVFVVVPVRLK